VPAFISVISGRELRERGAHDLRTALALTGGVDIAPGGDGGPASAVPALWGLREFDAYLLVVDGIPWGGVFNPQVATLDLEDVERIEILRGAAPVIYGATSFVGVIHIIHAAPGSGAPHASAGLSSRGNTRGAFATPFPTLGTAQHSLAVNAERVRYTQDRSGSERAHARYALWANSNLGTLRVVADLTLLAQDPYSPHPREGTALTTRFPLDGNVNPSNARQNQQRAQISAALSGQVGAAQWSTTLSLAHTRSDNVRGFLRSDFTTDGVTANADGFDQRVDTTELYFNSFLAGACGANLEWIAGLDWQYGRGRQRSGNFEYAVLPDGSNAPNSAALHVDERTGLLDQRQFGGLYGQLHWRAAPGIALTAGVRANHTRETRSTEFTDLSGPAPAPVVHGYDERNADRLTGTAGVTVRLYTSEHAQMETFADARNSYKPAAIDFGPEAETDILQPERSRSYELGIKGTALNQRLDWQAEWFVMRLRNLVIRDNVNGLPALANAGAERFRGGELEARWRLAGAWYLAASYAHHDAHYTDYLRLMSDGSLQQLAGKSLVLSPRDLASAGLRYQPPLGWHGALACAHLGAQYLDQSNSALAAAHQICDANLGYRWPRLTLTLAADNLGDSRAPVAESELGDAQFYRLPGRSLMLSAEAAW
jgi:iron complex outermembrane recepter protein